MIGIITKGSDFRGLLDYLLKNEKQPQVLNSQMLGQNASELAKEFNAVAAVRADVEMTVRHISLSFAPNDVVGDKDKVKIVDRVMKAMGYENCQFIAIAHHRDDPGHDLIHEHEHLHIVANAVSVFGERVSDSWDRLKIQPILREIEREFGLTPVVSSTEKWSQKKTVKQETNPEQTGIELAKIVDLASATSKGSRAAEEQPDLQTWLERLEQEKIDVRFTLKQDGTVRGIAYLQAGQAFKGSEIGKTWKSVGGKIAIGSEDAQIMAVANIKSQQHRMNMSEVERQRFERAVMMSATALDGCERLKTGRIHIRREDQTITAYRMRPHKEILKAVQTEQGWDVIGQPNIDDKDLELLSKVSGIARVVEIKSVQSDVAKQDNSRLKPVAVIEMSEFYHPNKAELRNWQNGLKMYSEVSEQLSGLRQALLDDFLSLESFFKTKMYPEEMPENYSDRDVSISPEQKQYFDDLLELAKQQQYCPSKGELFNWFNQLPHDPLIVDLIREVGSELKAAYIAEDCMQGKPEPAILPDEYRSLDVKISMQGKESMDRLVQKQMQPELEQCQSLRSRSSLR
jgi:hypothetical protein